jgi:hypothetical protein
MIKNSSYATVPLNVVQNPLKKIALVGNAAHPWQVLSELDLVSLARVGATCTRLYQLAQDPFLYTVLDLRQIFHTASSATLK